MKREIDERRLAYYPKRKYYKLFIAWCYENDLKKGEACEDIHKKFFDKSFSEEKQNDLLSLYNRLTPEELKLLRK